MSEKPDSTNDGGIPLDETQVEGVGGGSCTGSDIVGITQSLTQAYENLVDFTSHVIERVMIK
jgi:hypothetical protein